MPGTIFSSVFSFIVTIGIKPMSGNLPFENQIVWREHHVENLSCLDGKSPSSEAVFHYLHGNSFCAATLLPLVEELGPHYGHLLTDIHGHGRSNKEQVGQPDWNTMAQEIAHNISVRNNSSIIGVGHSFGGVLTLLMAAEFPHLFDRVILCDPVIFTPSVLLGQRVLRKTGVWRKTKLVAASHNRRSKWDNFELAYTELRSKSLYRNWTDEAFDYFMQYGTKIDQSGEVSLACSPSWEASIFASYPRRLWKLISQISVPVDILVAEKTYPFVAKAARLAAEKNPHVKVRNFGRTHCFPMEEPQALAEVIKQTLSLDSVVK